ncbi:phage repressor protein CI [Serratia marcescens]|uniref:phage repressor protein CI n=1 Tax=Serratia marcescens TaxID=615 RepID=UPI0038CACF27
MSLQIKFDSGSPDVLGRVIEVYGFKTKLALADHLGIASSSLAMRYKRGIFPSDIVVRCMAETGATLEWLATGKGKKFDDKALDILNIPRKKLVDGQLFESGYAMLDKVFFRAGVPLPSNPFCLLDEKSQYIVDRSFSEIYDGEWLVDIEGKISIRTLTRIPIGKVRVSGVDMAFDCALEDIDVLGRVVLIITEGN